MRILVTGASGLLGHEVSQIALQRGHEVYGAYREHKTISGTPVKLDLTDREELLRVVAQCKPQAVIHAAAYTNVDGCEVNRSLAWKTNAEATKHIAMATAGMGSHLLYVSTDYVFDGEKGFYIEHDYPNPINFYGYTKLKGEEFVRQYGIKWCIARPSVIYGWGPAHKRNFATWLLDNLNEGKEVKVLTDQHVSPTLNTNLAEMLLEIVDREITGILHTAGSTRANRYEFALRLAEAFNLDSSLVKPAKMDELPWKVRRPRDSSLSVDRALGLLTEKPLELSQAFQCLAKKQCQIDFCAKCRV